MAHSEFQAWIATVRMCVASFIVSFIDLKMTVFWFPESFCSKQQNPLRRDARSFRAVRLGSSL